MAQSELVPIISFKRSLPHQVILHKHESIEDALTEAGYSLNDNKRLKLIVDEDDEVLSKASPPRHISLAAMSEGHLRDPSLFYTPEQVRMKALLNYLEIRDSNVGKTIERVCQLDVEKSTSQDVHNTPLFEYDTEKNSTIANATLYPRFRYCSIHDVHFDEPFFVYPPPLEMMPLLEDNLTPSDLLAALQKAPFSSQTTFEIGSILYPFLQKTLYHFFSSAACHNIVQGRAILSPRTSCYKGGHILNKLDSVYKDLLFQSPSHAYNALQPPDEFRKCKLFSLRKKMVDLPPIFLKFSEIDECKTMNGDYPGYVATINGSPKSFLCKTQALFGRCLHQNLVDLYKGLRGQLNYLQAQLEQKPTGILYEKFLHEFWEYASYYSLPQGEREKFLHDEIVANADSPFKDFSPLMRNLYADRELYVIRDIFLITHKNRGGSCLRATRRQNEFPDPSGTTPSDLADDENHYLYTRERRNEDGKTVLFQYRQGLDGNQVPFIGPFNQPKNDFLKYVKSFEKRDPRIKIDKCTDCTQCRHLKTFYCSQIYLDQKPVVLQNPSSLPTIKMETSHCSFFFRKNNHANFYSNSTLISDLIYTISQLYLLSALATSKHDYYQKKLNAKFCVARGFYSDEFCNHDDLLNQFKNLAEIYSFAEALNDEFRALEVMRISTKFSLDTVLASEKEKRQLFHIEVSLKSLAEELFKLPLFYHLLYFGCLFDVEQELTQRIYKVTLCAFRWVMKDYYGDSGASGFEAEYPYNVIKEYDNLIADLKSTYYAKETQLDQLVHMLKVATKENFCHPLLISFLLKKFGSGLTEDDRDNLDKLDSISPDYLILFTLTQKPDEVPIFCNHRVSVDSDKYHAYFHLLKSFVFLNKFNDESDLRLKSNEKSLDDKLFSFLEYVKHSQFHSIFQLFDLCSKTTSIKNGYFQSYVLCAC